MKRGITIWPDRDHHDVEVVRIQKSRGKLTLSEIEDILRYEDNQRWLGHYVILLNCSEATLDGPGLFDEDEPKGDAVALYRIDEGEFCPVCGEYTPPFLYCPNCGAEWKNTDNNAEKLLALMKDEAVRGIQADVSMGSKAAWYWSHVGALDMARQLGFITEDRRQELYEDFRQFNPLLEGQEGGGQP